MGNYVDFSALYKWLNNDWISKYTGLLIIVFLISSQRRDDILSELFSIDENVEDDNLIPEDYDHKGCPIVPIAFSGMTGWERSRWQLPQENEGYFLTSWRIIIIDHHKSLRSHSIEILDKVY